MYSKHTAILQLTRGGNVLFSHPFSRLISVWTTSVQHTGLASGGRSVQAETSDLCEHDSKRQREVYPSLALSLFPMSRQWSQPPVANRVSFPERTIWWYLMSH